MAAHVFVANEVATKTNLDSLLPGRLCQVGVVKVLTVANTPTTATVTFPRPFVNTPAVLVTPATTVIGSQVKMVGVSARSTTGFTVSILRSNSVNTSIWWQAWAPPVLHTTNQPAYAGILNQSDGAPLTQSGRETITPVANTPTSINVTFVTPFAQAPSVATTPVSTVPGSFVKGDGAATEITTTGFKLWVYRTSASDTDVCWIATGRL
jgi:hypothetical protein